MADFGGGHALERRKEISTVLSQLGIPKGQELITSITKEDAFLQSPVDAGEQFVRCNLVVESNAAIRFFIRESDAQEAIGIPMEIPNDPV